MVFRLGLHVESAYFICNVGLLDWLRMFFYKKIKVQPGG